MDRTIERAKQVLGELDHFGQSYKGSSYTGATSDAVARVSYAAFTSERELANEPFIVLARAWRKDEGTADWIEQVYLVSRHGAPSSFKPVTDGAKYCTRNSPLGRIGSLDVEEELSVRLPDRRLVHLELIEKVTFRPVRKERWDAIESRVHFADRMEFVGSLRQFLADLAEDAEIEIVADDGSVLLGIIDEAERVRRAERKQSRTRQRRLQARAVDMLALRDQPVLDSHQDLFCRLPIDAHAIVTGAPGTGKTTTLIKRLAMALDPESRPVDEEIPERRKAIYYDSGPRWYLFSPSELLRRYVNEALGKEGLPSDNTYVRMWDSERANLGRDALRILKTGSTGLFKLERRRTLGQISGPEQVKIAKRFSDYMGGEIGSAVREARDLVRKLVDTYADHADPEKSNALSSSLKHLDRAVRRQSAGEGSESERDVVSAVRDLRELRPIAREARTKARSMLQRLANEILASSPAAVNQILSEIQIREDTPPSVGPELQARDAVARAARSQALASVRPGAKAKSAAPSTARDLVRDYAERSVDAQGRMRTAGMLLELRSSLDLLTMDFDSLLKSIPAHYAAFRGGDAAYQTAGFAKLIDDVKLGEDELDLLVHVMLRLVREILRVEPEWLVGDSKVEIIERVKGWYRAHVAIDEATDFSLLQVGAMISLAHPDGGSVMLAGDLMQRITGHGITDWAHCNLVSPEMATHELKRPYRHSPVLQSVAAKLYASGAGKELEWIVDEAGDDPRPLRFTSTDREATGRWIADRISEIYRIHQRRMVSVAVFVAEESHIQEARELLEDPLSEQSIDVEECPLGRILGDGSRVRIFSVQSIKGLEFEAVFFLDIDRLANVNPDLVDKYLYVGLTRAGRFLAVTSEGEFPEKLKPILDEFDEGTWESFVSLDK